MKKSKFKSAIFGIALMGLTAGFANATVIDSVTLADGNATAFFHSYTAQSGLEVNGYWKGWTVNDVSNLYQSKFCIRDNATLAPGNPFEHFHGLTMDYVDHAVTDTDQDGDMDSFYIKRSNDQMTFAETYTLEGGAAGTYDTSTIVHTAVFTNTTAESLSLSVFDHLDMDAGANYENDYGRILSATQGSQWDDDGNEIVFTMTEADHWSVGHGGCAGNYFDTHPGVSDLGDESEDGPLDIRFLLQWDIDLNPGESVQIVRTFQASPVPVPGSALLFGAGVICLGWFERRRKK